MRYEEFEIEGVKLRAVVSNGFDRLDTLLSFATIVGGPILSLVKQVTMKGGGPSEIKESFLVEVEQEDGTFIKKMDAAKMTEWIEQIMFEALRSGSRQIVETFLSKTQVFDKKTMSWNDVDLENMSNVKHILTWTFGTFKVQYSEFFPIASLSQTSPDKGTEIANEEG